MILSQRKLLSSIQWIIMAQSWLSLWDTSLEAYNFKLKWENRQYMWHRNTIKSLWVHKILGLGDFSIQIVFTD